MNRIYFDNNATTPLAPEVFDAMCPYMVEDFGNASSIHWYGQRAKAGMEKARGQVAKLLNARATEIVFTSGGTESDNAAILGIVEAARGESKHVVTTAIEHPAVLSTVKALERRGVSVTFVRAGASGLIDPADVAAALRPETVLISVMHANNELGTIQPLEEIGRIAQERDIYFHTDAVQSAGKIPLDVHKMGVDLLSLSAHKLNGPKGVGALYVRRRGSNVDLEPIIDGGGHEGGLRSGTLNVPRIVGLGKACEICRQEMAEESRRLAGLRDRLKDGLLVRLEGIHINGSLEHRLPNNLSVSFPGVDPPTLMAAMSDIALSSGSACTSGKPEPSYVLQALGLPAEVASTPLRFGLGRFTTQEEIDYCLNRLVETVKRLREMGRIAAA